MFTRKIVKILSVLFISTSILTVSSVSYASLVASQGRMLFLSQRKSDIEFKLQLINQRRAALAAQSAQLARSYANSLYANDTINQQPTLNSANPATPSPDLNINSYETQMAQVQAMDKALELRLKDLEVQQKEVQAEISAVKKVIDKNIESSFKTFS